MRKFDEHLSCHDLRSTEIIDNNALPVFRNILET